MLAVAWRAAVTAITLVGCRQVLGFDDTEVAELGAICTGVQGGNVTLCSPDAPVCMTLDGKTDFCTASCGTSPQGPDIQPPATGNAICASLASSGTPACGLADVADPATVTWYCEILCGPAGGQDFGSCPPGLTCTDGICR